MAFAPPQIVEQPRPPTSTTLECESRKLQHPDESTRGESITCFAGGTNRDRPVFRGFPPSPAGSAPGECPKGDYYPDRMWSRWLPPRRLPLPVLATLLAVVAG